MGDLANCLVKGGKICFSVCHMDSICFRRRRRARRAGETGIAYSTLWMIFDQGYKNAGILSQGTGKLVLQETMDIKNPDIMNC
jgi:hypothetical protein